jgi:hypothetical protein
MSRFASLSLAAATMLVTVGAGAALAMSDRQAIYVPSAGEHQMLTPNAKGHEMIMREARELPAGAIIYRSGGKTYLLENRKMASGGMLFDSMQQWFDQATGNTR